MLSKFIRISNDEKNMQTQKLRKPEYAPDVPDLLLTPGKIETELY